MKPLSIVVLHGASGDDPDERDTRETAEVICASLNRQGFDARIAHVSGSPITLPWAKKDRPGLVFNMVEAIDRDMQRAAEVLPLLEKEGIPYTGCSAAAQLATLSKTAQKCLMTRHGLPTPDWPQAGPALARIGRVIVKSITEHASLGMDAQSVVPGSQAAEEITRRQTRYGGTFFAEEYIEGREFNLSLLECGTGVRVLPPAEILFEDFEPGAPRIVDYAAKWDDTAHSYHHTPRRFTFPDRDSGLLSRLAELAQRTWTVFGLSGYARVDFRVDEGGRPWILEVNTNPCLAPDAGFAAAAEQAGMGYDALIAYLAALPLASADKDPRHVPNPQDC